MTTAAIITKRPDQIAIMREAGRVAAEALAAVAAAVVPGVTTLELDRIAEREIRRHGAIPSFKGLYGFPGSICSSVNHEIVHGIPSAKKVIRAGDLVKIDLGAKLNGFHADTATTIPCGAVRPEATTLMRVTREALAAGVAAACAGQRVRDVSAAIQRSIRSAGTYGIVRKYGGHGVGADLHEDPHVSNYLDADKSGQDQLVPGLVIAIEPMVNLGTWRTKQRKGDSWTVYTADGAISAHEEHTIAITPAGPVILTTL